MGKRRRRKKRIIQRKPTEYEKESRVIRISPELDDFIRTMRHRNESYDNVLRRAFGLPAAKYEKDTAMELFVLDDGYTVFTEEAKARGQAVVRKVQTGRKPSILKVRTVC